MKCPDFREIIECTLEVECLKFEINNYFIFSIFLSPLTNEPLDELSSHFDVEHGQNEASIF
jgi:hypothetical protein